MTNEQYLIMFLESKSESSKPQYRSSINRLFKFINNASVENITSVQLDEFLNSCNANKFYINAFITFVFSQPHNSAKQNWDIIKWCLPIECKGIIKF